MGLVCVECDFAGMSVRVGPLLWANGPVKWARTFRWNCNEISMSWPTFEHIPYKVLKKIE
nr:MAG TPA: hypothetical protein [Caudoviricetes sp.]DAY38070.1 MAG TPA: hypothetical protein [Caudoviricetes sp.]